MKKLISLIFVFLFSAGLCAAEENSYEKFKEVNTISSSFTMEKHLSIADRPLVSKGKFYFARPGFFRWEYTSPFPSGVILDGRQAWSWKNAVGEKEIKNISSQPFAKAMARQIYVFVSMNMKEIGARYNAENFKGGVILIPKDASAKQTIDKIKLYFNPSRDAVTKVEMLEKNGDKTVITFSGTVLNAVIPEEAKKP